MYYMNNVPTLILLPCTVEIGLSLRCAGSPLDIFVAIFSGLVYYSSIKSCWPKLPNLNMAICMIIPDCHYRCYKLMLIVALVGDHWMGSMGNYTGDSLIHCCAHV